MPTNRDSWMPVPKCMKVINGEDNSNRWQDFIDAFKDYALVDKIYREAPAIQMAKFRAIFGEENRTIIRNLELDTFENDAADEEGLKACKQLTATIAALEKRFKKHRNIIYQRYLLYRSKQNTGETARDFFDRINKQLKRCGFGNEAKQTLRDILVLGTIHPKAQEACFREDHEKMDAYRALQIIELFEDNEKTVKNIQEQQTVENTNVVKHHRSHSDSHRRCGNCGQRHGPKSCPAFHKSCERCHNKGHTGDFCRKYRTNFEPRRYNSNSRYSNPGSRLPNSGAKHHNNGSRPSNTINAVYYDEQEQDEPQDEWSGEEQIYATQDVGAKPTRKLFTRLNVKTSSPNRRPTLKTLLDTGATVNVMSLSELKQLEKDHAITSAIDGGGRALLKMYDQSITRTLGSTRITVIHDGRCHTLTFQIIDSKVDTLLSAQTCLELGLIQISSKVERVNYLSTGQNTKLESLTNAYEDIFNGLGKLPSRVKLYIKPNAIPVQQPPRKTPLAIVEPLIQRLREMERAGIIEKVDYPTEWVSNIVPVHREGKKLRVCLDPHYLNKALERPRFPMPTLEEALHKLRKAKIFTAIDARDGFYQMELDEASADATTFWSPIGRFRYRRVPQGISSAPEEYQKRQMQAYEGLKGVIVVADDTLVYGEGETPEEATDDHYRNLQALFERARQVGLKFNKEKLKLGVQEVKFLGHIISQKGLKADPGKIEAILKMPRPTDVKGIQTFLGCANYLLQFIPNLSEMTEPLRRLCQTEKFDFAWQGQQEEAFTKIKRQLTKTPTLAYFDQTKPIILQTDASNFGLGGVLLQEGKPVAYTSHSLSKTERNYAVIEKECLAILVTCNKFDKYVYGNPDVTVQTDHKPLEAIFSKPLDTCPKRLQRMRLALQRYNIRVVYIKGKTNFVADALSRNPLPTESEDVTELIRRIDLEKIEHHDPSKISDPTIERIRNATAADEELQAVIEAINSGWGEKEKKLLSYWNVRDELVHEKGVIYKGLAVVIPRKLRSDLLKKTHASHLGYDSMCRRAKDSLFWPGIKNDIKNTAAACDTCQTYRPAQQREPLIGKPVPSRPWQVIHQDLFVWNNCHYLVTVDGFSDYFELDRLRRDTTAAKLVNKTETLFARYGKADEIHTDSDPRYLAEEFQSFLRRWQTAHKASSPHYHQSNGKSESAVKAAKRLVKKCEHSGQSLQEALLEWRLTPQAEGLSPAEKFLGRKPASTIPTKSTALTTQNAARITQDIVRRRERQKKTYDKSARPLPELTAGQSVRIQPADRSHEWKTGVCVERVNPRTYRVRTEDGTQLIRNRRYLAAIPVSQSDSNAQVSIHRSSAPEPRAKQHPMQTRQRRARPTQAAPPRITTATTGKRPAEKRPAESPPKRQGIRRLRAATPQPSRTRKLASSAPMIISISNNSNQSRKNIRHEEPTPMDMSVHNNNVSDPGIQVNTSRRGRPILTPAKLK